MTSECLYTLQWDAPYPLKIACSHGGIWTPSNTWFPEPIRVLNPNSISIGSAVFEGLTSVTDRQTDHPTRSVTICASTYVVLQCGLITSGQSNLATGHIAAVHGWFSGYRQVAPVCTPT